MTEFRLDTDIANRALQHCGARRLGALGFAEDSLNASETKFSYGKLRRAELERNVWTFATRRAMLRAAATTTMLLAPALWVSTTTYFVGHIVADGNGDNWISNIPNNLGNDPTTTTVWEPYFGPMTVSLYDSTMTYWSGELVYTTAGDGTNRVYLSLISANADVPSTATAWDLTATYSKNDVVTRSAVAYMSLIDLNINQDPALAPVPWSILTNYPQNALVAGSDGVIYKSLNPVNNVGNDPTINGGVNWANTGTPVPWTTVFVGGAGSVNWLEVGGKEFPNGVALQSLNTNTIYPIGAGPSTQSGTLNVFRLPNGFLKVCSQDPKAGSVSFLGSDTSLAYKDWLLEGPWIVSRETGPIMFRFVADVTNVGGSANEKPFNTMFCEGLACRLALEVSPRLTQSSAKLADIGKSYERFMGEARTTNAIEAGSEAPPMDDYIACRF